MTASSQYLPVPKNNFKMKITNNKTNPNLLLEVKLGRRDNSDMERQTAFSQHVYNGNQWAYNTNVISMPASQPDDENDHLPGEKDVFFKWQISFCCLETVFPSLSFGVLFFFFFSFSAAVPRNGSISRCKMYLLKLLKNYIFECIGLLFFFPQAHNYFYLIFF